MKKEDFFEVLGELDDDIVKGAKTTTKRKMNWKVWGTIAACFAIVYGISTILFPISRDMVVSVYAQDTNEEITATGAVLMTGTIKDNGEMKGHPLMFYLSGQDIATVRFSCKNQQINFMDWTEKRDEYGNAQNFTVTYGEDESEYYYLTIDWIPNAIIRELTDNETCTIATLPEEMRNDIIVMEITFENGKTTTKAITISLLDDGTFFANFDDYKINEADTFVDRLDSEAIPRDILYAQGAIPENITPDTPPMVCINNKLYQQSKEKLSYTKMKNGFIYLGKIESDITDDQITTDGVPKENFQANHPIVGSEIYQYNDDVVIKIDGKYCLYEIIDDRKIQDTQNRQIEHVGVIPYWGISLSVENAKPAGLTLVCTQSEKLPTGELQMGSFYKLIVWNNDNNTWEDVPYLIKDIAWTEETYIIPLNDTMKWEVRWEILYGELSAGTYRIMKNISDFRTTGDYDTAECWAEFEIK